jgi:hypothetical protein
MLNDEQRIVSRKKVWFTELLPVDCVRTPFLNLRRGRALPI